MDRVERIQRIVLLLETKDEYVPAPRAHELGAKPGPAAGRRVPCGCARLVGGRLVARSSCLFCAGSGWRERIAPLDGDLDEEEGQRDPRGIVFDEYTYEHDLAEHPRRARLFGAPAARTMTRQEMDAELARLRVEEAVRAGDVDAEAYAWERAREARDRGGSYRELERALSRLRDDDHQAAALVVRVYAEGRYGRPPELPPALGAVVLRGLDALERSMPPRIRLPARLEERVRAGQRRATLEELVARGWKTSRIARELGITQEAAKRGVRRLSRSGRVPPIQGEAGAPG